MRHVLLPAAVAIILAAPVAAQDSTGISSSAISRCAGKAGTDARQFDPAFGIIMLDGMPWTTVERTEEIWDEIATTVSGTGARRRRDGTSVRFRFTCGLDTNGQALMFRASQLLRGPSDASAPAMTVLAGSAAYPRKMALPRGAELRVQLVDVGHWDVGHGDVGHGDVSNSPAGIILTEQVVRSGWKVPIPFALRLPKDTPLEGRTLALKARLVVRHQILFQLAEPRVIAGEDLRKPIELVLGAEQG
jgi:uncharacterized lipoprotein YbaY